MSKATEDSLRAARERRDVEVERANAVFDAAVADAYEEGWSLRELHDATGLSVNTVRLRISTAGIRMRNVGSGD